MPYEINDNRVDGGLLIEYGTQPCVLCGELISTDNIADFIRYRTEPCQECKRKKGGKCGARHP